MNEAFWAGLGGVLVVGGGVLGTVLTALYTYKSKTRKDVLAEWEALLTQCRDEGARQGRVLDEHVRAVEAVREEYAQAQEELAELYVWVRRYYDACCERDDILAELGRKPRPMPLPPQRRHREGKGDYLSRTAAQDASLARAAAAAQQPPSSGGTPPCESS